MLPDTMAGAIELLLPALKSEPISWFTISVVTLSKTADR